MFASPCLFGLLDCLLNPNIALPRRDFICGSSLGEILVKIHSAACSERVKAACRGTLALSALVRPKWGLLQNRILKNRSKKKLVGTAKTAVPTSFFDGSIVRLGLKTTVCSRPFLQAAGGIEAGSPPAAGGGRITGICREAGEHTAYPRDAVAKTAKSTISTAPRIRHSRVTRRMGQLWKVSKVEMG